MDRTSCVDSPIEQLSKLLTLPRLTSTTMENQIKALLLDLRFVKMFFSFLATLKAGDDQEIMRRLGSLELTSAQGTLEAAGCGLYQAGYFANFGLDIQDWETLVSNLLENVERLKPEVRDICFGVLIHRSWSWQSTAESSCVNEEILEFMDCILVNLERLLLIVSGKKDVMNNILPCVKKQIEALEEKLRFTRNFFDFTTKTCGKSDDKLEDFLALVQPWTESAACLLLLYWVEMECMDQNMAHRMNTMLSDSLQEIMPYTPRVTQIYLGLLKASKTSLQRVTLARQGDILVSFVGFLLENHVDSMKGDDIEILRERLILLISFLMNPPKDLRIGQAGKAFLKQIEAAIIKMTSLISVGGNVFLPEFLEKIHKFMTEIKRRHVRVPKSSDSNCAKTDGMGSIHFLLINIGEKCKASNLVPFANQKIVSIHRELHSLKVLTKDMMYLQNEYNPEALKCFWAKTISVAHRVEDVISSCSIMCRPIWYHLICLSVVLEEIKTIKTEVGQHKREKQTANNGNFNAEQITNRLQLSLRTNNSTIEGVVSGFNDEESAIVDLLTRGSSELSVVSIVGMSGVGKTTLAKIAYNNRSVQLHFHKLAWCSVGQMYRTRDLLLDILKCISPVENVPLSNMTDEELAEQVRKHLLRHRYLIVMDDIWDIGAWDAIKESLPKDRIWCRIVFTCQNRSLALQTDLSCNTYPLSVFTDEKSWKLLEEMLFHNRGCPQHLLDVGKKIARNCKGLPAAISEIAVLLQREERTLNRWEKIESFIPGIATEGCKDILELSYKHLPDLLKPCFLYFGAFPAGKAISARKLTSLWIAEGFVQRTEMGSMGIAEGFVKRTEMGSMGSLEVLAKDYLMELVSRSLVDITKRSSIGEIKACRVHDLLHNFCVEKAREEMFLHVDSLDLSHGSSTRTNHYPYRLCIHSKWDTFMQPKGICRHLYSLLVSSEIQRNESQLSSVSSQYFHSFKLLHILNLEGIYLDFSFPEEIISIVHLRYLAIRGSVMNIPSSIANLWNLRTLVVMGLESLICLPETIWKMKSLKHVQISEKAVISLGDHELEDSSLLVNNLKTFSTLALHHVADSKKLLRRLRGLQKLRCVVSGSQLYSKNKIEFPALAYLENLKSLTLCAVGYQGLASTCSWMHIQNQTFNLPSTLKKLTLYKLGIPWKAISIIRQLLNLEVLKLREQAFTGKRWDIADEDEVFCNLKFLELSKLNIEQWFVDNDPFPCLEQLVVGDCYRLVEIPLPFERISTLQVIELRRCSNGVKSSAMVILKEQRDWGNDELEVLILDS